MAGRRQGFRRRPVSASIFERGGLGERSARRPGSAGSKISGTHSTTTVAARNYLSDQSKNTDTDGAPGKVFPTEEMRVHLKEHTVAMIPMKRFGTSEEIAKAVLCLAFDATFTTGI